MKILLAALLVSPAIAFTQATVFRGATLHIGNGQVVENGNLVVDSGRIVYAGSGTDGRERPGAQVIDVSGQHIYPGFIAPNCVVGLNEIDAARATHDYQETGPMKPNIRSLPAYNTDSKIIPTLRFCGVLMVQAVPQGGTLSGTSSILNLAGWNWEDAALKADDGLHLHWHETTNPSDAAFAEKHKAFMAELTSFIDEATAYCRLARPAETNLKFEALRPVLAKSRKLFVHVHTAKGIAEVLSFLDTYKLSPVLVGAEECYLLMPLLKQKNVPVVLMNVHRLPDRPGDPLDLPYRLPAMLKEAGIPFCLGIGGSWEVRNLPFQAGTLAGYGLTREEALASITSQAAAILGIDSLAGTLATGKVATFFVSAGDALDMKGNQLTHIFIAGKQVPVDGQQQELNRRFLEKYWGK